MTKYHSIDSIYRRDRAGMIIEGVAIILSSAEW